MPSGRPFGVEIREGRGVVRVRGECSERLLPERPTPNAASKPTTYSGRGSTASPSVSSAGACWGNVKIGGRDLREGSATVSLSTRS